MIQRVKLAAGEARVFENTVESDSLVLDSEEAHLLVTFLVRTYPPYERYQQLVALPAGSYAPEQ